MAVRTTLGDLIDQHFGGTLCVTSIGDMRIAITNDPDFSAHSFTVVAAGTSKTYGYPLFGSRAFTLTDIGLTLTYKGPSKPATGSVSADLNFGGIDLNVKITLSRDTESFSVTSQLTDPISLVSVVENLSNSNITRPPGLAKNTKIEKICMTIGIDESAGRSISAKCKLDTRWTLPVAHTKQFLTAGLVVQYDGKKKLALSKLGLEGELKLTRTRSLEVSYDFGPKLSKLTGSLFSSDSPIVPRDFLRLFGINVQKGFPKSIGSVKGIDLAAATLELDFASNVIQFSGQNSLKEDAFARAQKLDSKWIFAMGIATKPGWKVANLSNKLKPVDDFLSLGQSYLVISTDSQKIDDSVFSAMGKHSFNVVEGLSVGAAVKLDKRQTSLLAKALHGLLGGDVELFLEATLGPKPSLITFSASFVGDLELRFKVPNEKKPATLTVESPELMFSLEPSLHITGGAMFPTSTTPMRIDGGFDISPQLVRFRGQTDLPMPPPKTSSGLKLKAIGAAVTAEPETLEMELNGDMYIGDDHAGFAFQLAVPEMVPTFLYAQFDSLDLAPMFSALCKTRKLPKPLAKGIQFHHVTIWNCVSPTRKCVRGDGSEVDFGFAFEGGAKVFGFPADANLAITDQGMSGSLSMGRSINVPGIFTVSDRDNHKLGPQFEFNTNASPYLKANYFIDVLGIKDTAKLSFTDQGFSLNTSIGFQGRKIKIVCVLGARQPGDYIVKIGGSGDFRKRPIVIKIPAGILGHISVTIYSLSIGFSSKAETFTASIQYKIYKKEKKSVSVTLGEIGHDIENLGKKIEEKLKKSF